MSSETVEWGTGRKRPQWAERLRLGIPGRYLALGFAVFGFALIVAAELLPWLDVEVTGSTREPDDLIPQGDVSSMRLNQLMVWQAPAYYIGLTALLALIAVALFGRPTTRRAITAAAIGIAAGHAVLLAGLYATISEGGDFFGNISRLREISTVRTGVGIGFYAAAVGLLLLITAVGVLGAAGRPRPVIPEATAESPPDLTVTAVVS